MGAFTGSGVLRGDERGAAIIGRQAQVQGVGAYTAGLPIRAPRRVQLDPAGLPLSSDLHVLHACHASNLQKYCKM